MAGFSVHGQMEMYDSCGHLIVEVSPSEQKWSLKISRDDGNGNEIKIASSSWLLSSRAEAVASVRKTFATVEETAEEFMRRKVSPEWLACKDHVLKGLESSDKVASPSR